MWFMWPVSKFIPCEKYYSCVFGLAILHGPPSFAERTMSEKQKPHVDQLEEDDEFEEFDQVRFFQAVLRIHKILALKRIRIHTSD